MNSVVGNRVIIDQTDIEHTYGLNNGAATSNTGRYLLSGNVSYEFDNGNSSGGLVLRENGGPWSALSGGSDLRFLTGGTSTNQDHNDYTASLKMVVKSSGNVGIGNASPSQRLSVGASGDGSVAIANSWTTYSDKRLKKDVSIIDSALEKISKLAGYFFYWKKGDDSSRQVGVMAQDVEEIFPEVVKTGSDGIKSVDYPKLVAPVIQAIKELKAEKDQEISSLKSENEAMKSLLCEIRPDAAFCAK